ncbi:MAG TPA: phage tail tube protein [Methylomirabilota bacterium]|jgi:hypothetical protein|nr:phage tail tube protein [Methylomirabilota bacterium]
MGYAFGGHIGIAKESSWGTPIAIASGGFIEGFSENVTLAIDRFSFRNIVGGNYAENDDTAGYRRIGGQLVVPAHPLLLGHFLKGALGLTSTITVVVSGFLWESDFRALTADDGLNNATPPYTLEIFRDVTSSQRYAGAQFTKLQLDVQGNQELRVTADVLAKTTSTIAKSTPTYPATGTFPFAFDSTSLQIGGAAVDYVETLSISFDNQLEGVLALTNSPEITRTRRTGPQLVRLEADIGFETMADYNRFVSQSEVNVVASWTKANSFALIMRLPRVMYTAFPLGMSGDERIKVHLQALGRADVTLGYAIQARLTTVMSNF